MPVLLHVEHSSPEELAYFRSCFLCFGIGSALVFPFGMFQEILVGLQRLYLRNYINVVSKLVELAGILVIFALGGGLITLILFTVILTALTQLSMLFFIRRLIPGFRLRFRVLPDPELFREIFHFSGFVYLTSVARLAWGRSGALLISIFCGLGPTAVYQLGGRLPALMGQLTGPYQENISPITALLHSRNKVRRLGLILRNSMRWNSFLATGMTVGILFFSPVLLRFLFRVESPEAIAVCRIMTLSIYLSLVFRTIPERYFLMADSHRFLSWLVIGESVCFVILSIVFLPHYQEIAVVCCAFGGQACRHLRSGRAAVFAPDRHRLSASAVRHLSAAARRDSAGGGGLVCGAAAARRPDPGFLAARRCGSDGRNSVSGRLFPAGRGRKGARKDFP